MIRHQRDGLVTYTFESLGSEGLVHAVFSRLGGVSQGPFSSLNVGSGVGDDEQAVAQNHTRIFSFLGLSPDEVTTAHQVHGNHVAEAGPQNKGSIFPATDGLITATPRIALLLRFADCQPILLFDPIRRAVGLFHCGWRGVALALPRRAVEAMRATFGTEPHTLIAGLGPAIGPCCYTVGDNVAGALGYALSDWRRALRREGEGWRLDLSAANEQLLASAGVLQVEHAALCTSCRRDEFFSHRADGGRTGRFAALAYLTAAATPEADGPRAAPPPDTGRSEDCVADSLQPPGLPTFGELVGEAA